MATHNFSNLDIANFEYALYLIKNNEYIKNSSTYGIKLVNDHLEIAKKEMKDSKYPFRDLWINLSLGIEILAKSVLIKHEIDIFSKKNGEEYKSGWHVSASGNPWLEQIFKSKDIKFVNQINTGTLWNLYTNKVEELLNKAVISSDEKDEIENGLKQLAQVRRNNDLHFYFKQNAFMKANDLKKDYVPLINLLIDIYNR